MAGNRVVARYRDGRVVKGITSDFLPARPAFHLESADGSGRPTVLEVQVTELKAVFFVKDFAGNPARDELKRFPSDRPVVGRKMRVLFTDGEELVGTTQGYEPHRPGFFLVPADPQSNIDRCYIVTAATRAVRPA